MRYIYLSFIGQLCMVFISFMIIVWGGRGGCELLVVACVNFLFLLNKIVAHRLA